MIMMMMMMIGAAPVIRSLSTAVRVLAGHSVQLNCQVTGRPKPQISWFKDNDSYTPPSDRGVTINKFVVTVVSVNVNQIFLVWQNYYEVHRGVVESQYKIRK